ncbi:hypothetical protein [Pseudomonas phage D6]|nr:hypothetical protein [Pseudomonas phage D6]
MSDVSKIQAVGYAEKNGLREKITINESGLYTIPADLRQVLVLDPLGVSAATYKKIEQEDAKLLGGLLYIGGELATGHFKANPDAMEVGFNYQQGDATNVSVVFNREAKDHTVIAIETKHKTPDIKRVLSWLGDEFANINS